MRERFMRRLQRCTYCNSRDIDVHLPDDLGIVRCICNSCGNKWGQ